MSREMWTTKRATLRLDYAALVIVILLALVVGHEATASAASLNWYWGKGGNENCWQTGGLGSEAAACDTVGPGFLETPGRLTTGGIGQNVVRTPDGDFCDSYSFSALNKQDASNEGGTTGLTTATPYGSYQEWDGSGDVCQADGSSYGQEIHKTACSVKTCGMNHYVSLTELGHNDQPWASAIWSSPSLVLSTEADLQTLTGSSPGAWGYICPVFQDMTSSNILEYCFQEWRGSGNAKPEWEDERIGSCAFGPSNNSLDTVQTYFYPGTSFAENLGPNTTGVASAGWKTYSARITEADLKNAIELDRRGYKEKSGNGSGESTPEIGYGCGRENALSTEPKNYALIGVEQGVEGWNFTEIGASARNLQLHTEYTPLAPEATLGNESEVGELHIKLNGTVNSHGSDTHYYFQYGPTTSYGTDAPAAPGNDAGSGIKAVAASATVSGLLPGTTYHYRLVAKSAAGESITSDKTFTTAYEEASSRWAARQTGTTNQYVFYRKSSNEELWETFEPGTGWGAYERGLEVAPGTTPAVALESSSGHTYVFYQGHNGALWQTYEPGTGWGAQELGRQMAPGTSPSVVRNPRTGQTYVFYQGSNGALWETLEPGAGWGAQELGGQMAANTSPAAMIDPLTGHIWVFYQGSNGALWQTFEPGTGWGMQELGRQMAPGTSPSAIRDPSTGAVYVFYQGSNGALWQTLEPGGGWGAQELGLQMAPDTSPSAVGDPSTGQLAVFYQGKNNALWETLEPGAGWGAYERGGQMAPGTSPAALRDPVTGKQWVYYEGSNGQLWETFEPGTGWGAKELGLQMSWSLPSVDTKAASSIQETQATLNGTIDPQGAESKYDFEYGPTNSYGNKTSEVSGGAGIGSKEVSQVVSGLTFEASYHYRLVIRNANGTTYGEDHTVKTVALTATGTSPAAVRDPNTGAEYVFFQGRNSYLYEWSKTGATWTQSRLGGKMAADTSPSVVRDSANGHIWVFYQGSNGTLTETYEPGTGWGKLELSVPMAAGTSPSAELESGADHIWVFYQGSNGKLWEALEPGAGWGAYERGRQMAADTSPSVIRAASSGHQWVYYQGSGGELWETLEPGTGWGAYERGRQMAADTSPSAVTYGTTSIGVFYQGSNNQLWETFEPGTGWGAKELGRQMAEGTSPSAVTYESSHIAVFYQGSNNQLWETFEPGAGWGAYERGGQMSPYTSPSAISYSSHFVVFYQGSDGQIWKTSESGTGWSSQEL